jgi:protein gp37
VGSKTEIEWSEASWNPTTGCDKISEGCKHCYAHDVAKYLQTLGNPKYKLGMQVTDHGGKYLDVPKKWRKGKRIFIDSMGDLFHDDVSDDFILQVLAVMLECPQHQFQLLTKRPERMQRLFSKIYEDDSETVSNLWVGVTAENQRRWEDRIPMLIDTPASIRWVSIGPMLSAVDVSDYVDKLDWVVIEGECQPQGKWREMKEEWVLDVRDKCVDAGTPFFFKNWNARGLKVATRVLDGRTWSEYPDFKDIGDER